MCLLNGPRIVDDVDVIIIMYDSYRYYKLFSIIKKTRMAYFGRKIAVSSSIFDPNETQNIFKIKACRDPPGF